MSNIYNLTAIIKREKSGYSALCPQINLLSHGKSIDQTLKNISKAAELFCKRASSEELNKFSATEFYITSLTVGTNENG